MIKVNAVDSTDWLLNFPSLISKVPVYYFLLMFLVTGIKPGTILLFEYVQMWQTQTDSSWLHWKMLNKYVNCLH